MPPGSAVTVYDDIGLPPLDAGGVKFTTACPFPLTAVPIIGASGTVAGVTAAETADACPDPTAFVALTVKLYAVPFVSPVTVIGLVFPVSVFPPTVDVTVYDVMATPPLDKGGVKKTVAWVFPLIQVTAVGAPGSDAVGAMMLEGADGSLVPRAFFAITVNV
ncbi:MAG: hypothetical protein WC637_03420 [Victivallales bacterium]|jgi:hypothetical protein